MRQIDIALKQIDRRTHNTFALRASLQGVKIPTRSSAGSVPEISPEDEAAADAAMQKAIARKQAEMRARG